MKRDVMKVCVILTVMSVVACGGAVDSGGLVNSGDSQGGIIGAEDSDSGQMSDAQVDGSADETSGEEGDVTVTVDDNDEVSEEGNDAATEMAAQEETLTDWLAGTFDTSAQEQTDRRFFNISLKGCRVDAPDFGDNVLYIEQASADSLTRPYRQRLYVISAGDDGTLTSVIYALNNPGDVIGLCDANDSVTFTEADVKLREGCEVYLEWMGDKFVGSTGGKACSSTLGGAAYATSEVEIEEDRITSWDRGYDADDVQVWGAEAGAYVFLRQD